MQDSEQNQARVENQDYGDTLLGPNSHIAERLRAFYLSVQDEGIPERFLALLTRLDQAEKKSTAQ